MDILFHCLKGLIHIYKQSNMAVKLFLMWNCTHFNQTEGFCFRWRPVLQVLALEMVQLPPADGELHTPHAVPACFEDLKHFQSVSQN